jgi:hypothetical protein
VLLLALLASVKVALVEETSHVGKGKESKYKDSSVAKVELSTEVVQILLPLLQKYAGSTTMLVPILRLIQAVDLTVYQQSGQIESFKVLFSFICGLYTKHEKELCLKEIAATMLHVQSNSFLLQSIEPRLAELQMDVASSLVYTVGELVSGCLIFYG